MLDQNKLYESLLSWIDNNQPKVAIAQKMANEINNLHLINSYRKLPFEIVPVDNEAEEFKLTVFLDHPKLGSWDLVILYDGISIKNLDKPEEVHDLKTYENIFDFINEFDDENAKIYHDFQLAVESRNYTIVNKLLSSELKKYHEAIDNELKSIKKILTSTENSGLTNPSDGSVSYLNRVMGRWDLALLWTPCPFVVVSDPEITASLQDRIYDFKILEQESCQVINNMQKLCVMSDMDVEIRTDSKDTEMDASGWVTLDELGIPKIGPLIHAVKVVAYSKFEGNLRKEQPSSRLIL
jgi:hydrogenase maturation factor